MNFDLNVQSSTEVVDGVVTGLIVTNELIIKRDEIIACKEADDMKYCETLRSIVYMYHFPHGYVTQLTDCTMHEMYNHVIDDKECKGIVFQVIQKEIITESDTLSKRGQTINLDTFWI